MILGTLDVGRDYIMVPVAMTNYRSVFRLHYEQYHTRLLLFGATGRPFWSPVCEVTKQGLICAMSFKSKVWLQILNITVADYDRREMAKALDFMPFEIAAGREYKLQYHFLLRGNHAKVQ